MAVLWTNLAESIKPFPDKAGVDTTEAMRRQNWTVRTILEKGDEFFQSIGLEPMPQVQS